jgi:hypothetical protein
MAAAAAIAGGASAGGGIAGALLNKTPSPSVSAPNLDTSPGLKIAEFMNMIDQGIYYPQALTQSSPMNIMIGEINSSQTLSNKKKSRILRDLKVYTDWIAAGRPGGKGGITDSYDSDGDGLSEGQFARLEYAILQFSGYGGIGELLEADAAYTESIQPMLQSAQGAAQGNFQAKLDMQAQVRDLLGDLPDASASGIAALRADEKERLLRDMNLGVDEQRSDLLEVANAGGFNPGRPLGDLEEFRAQSTQDADLIALDRALKLIGGQQGVAGTNLGLLLSGTSDSFNRTMGIAQADQGFQGGSAIQGVNNQGLANGIASAGNSLGQGISDYYTAQETSRLNDAYIGALNSNKPGVSPVGPYADGYR